jgi:hypothetical protein
MLEQPLVFAWGPGGSVAELAAVFVRHERAHAKEIEELFRK